jgi:RNA polymerase primary sigma factor
MSRGIFPTLKPLGRKRGINDVPIFHKKREGPDLFQMAKDDIEEVTPCTREEAEDLQRRAQRGSIEAHNELAARTMRIVWWALTKKAPLGGSNTAALRSMHTAYKNKRGDKGLDLDLLQEGAEGLLIALSKWNSSKGSITTYAPYWILHRITRYLNTDGIIRQPVRPVGGGIARAFPMDPQEVNKLGGAYTIDEEVEQQDKHHVVIKLLASLPLRNRWVLSLRFGILDGRERSLQEIGNIMGVTRERIRQIEIKGLKLLRHRRKCGLLHAYYY